MSNIDTARAMIEAWETHDTKKMASLLSDDFVVTGLAPMPLNKEAYLNTMRVHNEAFPDWKFNASEYKEEGDTVRVTVSVTGTQTGVFDVGKLGLPIPPIPATGKFIRWPAGEELVMTIKGDQVVAGAAKTKPGGALIGVLERLGVQLPAGR